jgi:hypothetical protein
VGSDRTGVQEVSAARRNRGDLCRGPTKLVAQDVFSSPTWHSAATTPSTLRFVDRLMVPGDKPFVGVKMFILGRGLWKLIACL